MERNNFKLVFFLLPFFLFIISSIGLSAKVVSNKKIWEGDKYAAFTSLVRYRGEFYCAFRNANHHADVSGKDCGVIKIIRSKNAEDWHEFLLFKESGIDLRDPQLSITPDGKLMLMTECVLYSEGYAKKRNTCVSFIRKDGSYTELKSIEFPKSQNWNWIWNIEWIDGVAYGFCYVPYFGLVKSVDGIHFDLVEKIEIEGHPTEASIGKLNKRELLSVIRMDDSNAVVGHYDLNSKKWTWNYHDERIDCPKFISAGGNKYVVGKTYERTPQTTLFKYSKSDKKLKRYASIKGGKDCSYPGIIYAKNKFYVSYYIGDGKQSDIYLAVIR